MRLNARGTHRRNTTGLWRPATLERKAVRAKNPGQLNRASRPGSVPPCWARYWEKPAWSKAVADALPSRFSLGSDMTRKSLWVAIRTLLGCGGDRPRLRQDPQHRG